MSTVRSIQRLHKLRVDDEPLSLASLLLGLGPFIRLLLAVHLVGGVGGVHTSLGLSPEDLVGDAVGVGGHALLDLASLRRDVSWITEL